MQFWRRISVIILCSAAVACLFIVNLVRRDDANILDGRGAPKFYNHHHADSNSPLPSRGHPRSVVAMSGDLSNRQCTMGSCFDHSRCEDNFKVYVYPQAPENPKISTAYQRVLKAIRNSRYYTPNVEEACLLVPSIDTMDRDKLSKSDFMHGLAAKLNSLPHWNGGTNHLLFNQYSGTWPDYAETMDVDTGNAILAKASLSKDSYRPEFDVSLPLFPKNHPERDGGKHMSSLELLGHTFPLRRPYLAAFKGKRYTFGKGGEVRNALHHLHNEKDIVLLTTCRHGTEWSKYQDARCSRDDVMYDKYDYKQLLVNASFCLIPSGRRLGTFRFIESLQSSCIPVSLSNNYVLPFSEVIDWTKASVLVDERQLLQVPHMLRSISDDQLLKMRLQTQFLWDAYFSSVDSIVQTTLEIIRQRIQPHLSAAHVIWNKPPGALVAQPQYSTFMSDFPFYRLPSEGSLATVQRGYTALIEITSPVSPALVKLVKSLSLAPRLRKIVVVSSEHRVEPSQLPNVRVPIAIVNTNATELQHSFSWPLSLIQTDGVLSLTDQFSFHHEEAEFGFDVWQHHPSRVVGFVSHSHNWDVIKSRWAYSVRPLNQYSVVASKPAFLHKYYSYLFSRSSFTATELSSQSKYCHDLAMNFLISSITKKPPVKVLNRNYHTPSAVELDTLASGHWRACLNMLANKFGYMVLRHSMLRMDPSLFKDNVSVVRKQYRKLEILT